MSDGEEGGVAQANGRGSALVWSPCSALRTPYEGVSCLFAPYL